MNQVRVLLVDDEMEFVSALRERLELRGFVAQGAGSGADALEALAASRWDVVVVDVRMPGLDGFELGRTIRARYPRSAVVLLSGRSTAQDVASANALGALAYLVKPVSIDELAHVLRAAAAREEGRA